MTTKILITGSSGYIGSNLAYYLIKRGVEIIGIDIHSTPASNYLKTFGFKFYHCDIRDEEKILKIVSNYKITHIIHLAALKSVEKSNLYQFEYQSVNIEGTEKIAKIALNSGVKKLIFASSAAVYGEFKNQVVSEEEECNPLSYYGQTKLKSEKYLENLNKSHNILCYNLRFFNVIGSLNRHLVDNSTDNVIPIFINLVKKNERPIIFGNDYNTKDGTAVRDYIYVGDVIRIIENLIFKIDDNKKIITLNIGTGIAVSVLELANFICTLKNSNIMPIFKEKRNGDVSALVADISKLALFMDVGSNKKWNQVVTELFLSNR